MGTKVIVRKIIVPRSWAGTFLKGRFNVVPLATQESHPFRETASIDPWLRNWIVLSLFFQVCKDTVGCRWRKWTRKPIPLLFLHERERYSRMAKLETPNAQRPTLSEFLDLFLSKRILKITARKMSKTIVRVPLPILRELSWCLRVKGEWIATSLYREAKFARFNYKYSYFVLDIYNGVRKSQNSYYIRFKAGQM